MAASMIMFTVKNITAIIKYMISFTSTIKVTYSDTDQMGYMHHNNYVKYYENARWAMFEHLGIPYAEVERKGFMLPVTRMDLKFVRPAYFDELLTVETTLCNINGARIVFRYKVFNKLQQLVNRAEITLVFIDSVTRLPCINPDFFIRQVKKHIPAKQ